LPCDALRWDNSFVRLGVHLPLADFGDGPLTAEDLGDYTRAARELGYTTVSANDHLVWRLPWLDGPTALASVASSSGDMVLATSIALPVVRHPVVVAKMLTTLATLADGPVVGGLGPGSSRADYDAVGVPFEQRWARFDEAIRTVRALVRGEPAGEASFYPTDLDLMPRPDPPPQVWFGSWGSDRRIAATVAVADGWFASAYNATPTQYGETRARLDMHLRAAGRDPAAFPDAVATTWLYITDDRRQAEHVLVDVLSPALNRDPDLLAHLPIGSAAHCADVLAEYAAAGAREVLLWPVRDGVRQLELCSAAASSL
jgi:alkanesulfonate monooxygenase SsuD/methylene tetrahydromethanopterin reductase-like flavin-dependent oxidoreductase (luciferase family)